MRILIDASIEHAALFAPLGDLHSFPARNLDPAQLADAEALIIRSTTRLGEPLIAAAPRLRFVGTLTTGTDHIDTVALARRNITLADAAGCNSRAVAEYVIAAILHLADTQNFDPAQKTLGIIGFGRIGALVAQFAAALNMPILACDPPLFDAGLSPSLNQSKIQNQKSKTDSAIPPYSLRDLAERADIITAHVPLTQSGPHPTHHMLNTDFFAALKPGAIVINTSRGEVLDESAVNSPSISERAAQAPSPKPQAHFVLDVFHHEPRPNPDLIAVATLATPHIAGQTADARHRAAVMIRNALAAHVHATIPPASVDSVHIPQASSLKPQASPWRSLNPLIQQIACLAEISENFQRAAVDHAADPATFAIAFDQLRSRAAQRREFPSQILTGTLDPLTQTLAAALGFSVAS